MYEQRTSTSFLVNCVWHAIADSDDVYSDPANEYWGIGFTRHTNGALSAELFGPSIAPRILNGFKGEEYWGIEFHAHVVIKGVDKTNVLNTAASLPVKNGELAIREYRYPVPTYDTLEAFAAQLEKDGVILHDQRIFRALNGDENGFSERSRQRHVKAVTGLNKKQIEQLQRARHAFYLLQSGSSVSEAAHLAGYADQSHMTRSLKLLRGETPARIISAYLKSA